MDYMHIYRNSDTRVCTGLQAVPVCVTTEKEGERLGVELYGIREKEIGEIMETRRSVDGRERRAIDGGHVIE